MIHVVKHIWGYVPEEEIIIRNFVSKNILKEVEQRFKTINIVSETMFSNHYFLKG